MIWKNKGVPSSPIKPILHLNRQQQQAFGGVHGRSKLQKKVHKMSQRQPERSQQEEALSLALGMEVDAEP